jgi:hypothetical protein
MNRRTFIHNMAGMAGVASVEGQPGFSPSAEAGDTQYKLYWGDLHTHCNITYGHGSMEDALEAATAQLDFCAIVAHALWPDAPVGNQEIRDIVDYHFEAFRRVRKNWDNVQALNVKYRKPGQFIPFLSYECHSMRDGDHNVYHLEPRAPILDAASIADLKSKLQGQRALVIPHHMGYMKGYRGFNWDSFVESDQTPFVEIYSRHGCSEIDVGPYPALHDMGPRSHEGTAEEGLRRGHKFGMIASTDQHAGYPGSYGDGKIGVYATALTPEALWEAFLARRVFGVTGDRIGMKFHLNDAWMGRAINAGGKRRIHLSVEGDDLLDYADLIKNGKRIARFSAPFLPDTPTGSRVRAKVRVEWGWGRNPAYTEWNGRIALTDGQVLGISPCFRGQPITSPQGDEVPRTHVSRILEQSSTGCAFQSYTTKNPNTITPMTNSLVLDVEMDPNAAIHASVNGKNFEHTLKELMGGTRSHWISGWINEALVFHRAIPEAGFLLEQDYTDSEPEQETDYYYLRVREHNNQWAWSSPIWVSS